MTTANYFNFKTVNEIVEFQNKLKTDQANILGNDIKQHIIYTSKSFYIYNETSKLWVNNETSLFFSYLCKYLSNTVAHVKSICEANKVVLYCLCKHRTKTCDTCIGVAIMKVMNNFDNDSYIQTIEKRMTINIRDDQNLTKLDSQCDYLPIKDGKKINLQTLEVTERTKEDYFTSFCNVSLEKDIKHAG
jgi:hypothetical protein